MSGLGEISDTSKMSEVGRMNRYTMVIDAKKCIGCYSCVIACKMEHNLPPFPSSPPETEPKGVSPIRVLHVQNFQDGRFKQLFVPLNCKHCLNAPCMRECPTEAIYKEDGITLVDREKCIGCKVCLEVCPYGIPQFDDEGVLVLCDMCIHRLKEGKKAACEHHCVANCIQVVRLDEVSNLRNVKYAKRKLG